MTVIARRTQQQRREHTRALVIDAAIATIGDSGYRSATTRQVATRAGVSLGAVAHHFPARADLIAAALDEVGQRLVTDLRRAVEADGGTGRERTVDMLDTIWTGFTSDLFAVWLKVWIAASEDPELYAALAPIESRLSQAIAAALLAQRPANVSAKQWTTRAGVALDAMRGLALIQTLEPRTDRTRDRWPATRHELARLMDHSERGSGRE